MSTSIITEVFPNRDLMQARPRQFDPRERCVNLAGRIYVALRRVRTVRPGKQVVVLNYHRIAGDAFKAHLEYIRANYRILSPNAFLSWVRGQAHIEKPSVLITFDDGYGSFYEEVYPLLFKAQVPALMFVTTGFVGTPVYFWEDELGVALEKSKALHVEVCGKRFPLLSRLYRMDFHEPVRRHLRSMTREKREEFTASVLAHLKVTVTKKDMAPYRFLTWQRIREMKNSGLVEFGSHSVTHPCLAQLDDGSIAYEVRMSKEILEDRIKAPVRFFAYPYGDGTAFDARATREVEQAGYLCAFTAIQGSVQRNRESLYMVNRLLLFEYQNKGAVALKMACIGGRVFRSNLHKSVDRP